MIAKNTFRPHCLLKFAEYIGNGRFDGRWTLEECLDRSEDYYVTPIQRHYIAFTFSLSAENAVWIRRLWRGPHFQLFFIGCDNEVVEICSYRTIRQLGKKWYQKYLATLPDCTPMNDIVAIFKHASFTKLQGGLMRGESKNRKNRRREMDLAQMPHEKIENPRLP